MENLFTLLLGLSLYALIIVGVVKLFKVAGKKYSKIIEAEPSAKYEYRAKEHLMTRVEEEFFNQLRLAVSQKYYVFPQVHLSAILDHKVAGQDYMWAFRHIHQKSVDYVLCDKHTLKPTYAIELDDYTHNQQDRIERDKQVSNILKQAGLPLVRFRDKSPSREEIIRKLSEALITTQPIDSIGPRTTETPTPDKTPA